MRVKNTDVQICVARQRDREEVKHLINAVVNEETFLQTSAYQATPAWERLLSEGVCYQDGFVLLIAEVEGSVVGFVGGWA